MNTSIYNQGLGAATVGQFAPPSDGFASQYEDSQQPLFRFERNEANWVQLKCVQKINAAVAGIQELPFVDSSTYYEGFVSGDPDDDFLTIPAQRPTLFDVDVVVLPEFIKALRHEVAEAPRTTPESVEMRWLVSHTRELSQYAGEWLLIQGEMLLAHSSDFRQIKAAIARHNIRSPFVYYVPSAQESNWISI